MSAMRDAAGLDRLRSQVNGSVLRPGDPGWEAAVSGFNAAVTHRPTLVVTAADRADVQAAVRYAATIG